MINEHTLEVTRFLFIYAPNTNCMQINWLPGFIRLRAGLLVRVSNCYKQVYYLSPIVRLSAFKNYYLFTQQQLDSYSWKATAGANSHHSNACMLG